MGSLLLIVDLVLSFAWWVIIIQAVMSWLVSFNILNASQPFVYQIYSTLNRMTEPVYRPIRNFMPDLGGIDLSPIIVLIGIQAIRIIIANNIGLLV